MEILDPVFGTVNTLGKVGAPIQEAIAARVTIQPFTKGMALWLESDAGSIHVLLDSGAWREYHDSPMANASDPRLDDAGFTPPPHFSTRRAAFDAPGCTTISR